ncbi:DUF1826 domain-containing protein [Chitinophaga skermanii]|nr:hypothetical protein [Chitinophaga skermanii]
MIDLTHAEQQIQCVNSFQELVSTPFQGRVNAMCWERTLVGDFAEIVHKITLTENVTVVDLDELCALDLTKEGQLARAILLQDFQLLKDHGASPVLNVISYYDRDDIVPFFPTDVYSYHVDRSPIPTDTILCTYHGDASDILPNSQVQQKITIPSIRAALMELYEGAAEDFASFLSDNFFDLHYQANPGAIPINLGQGNLWRLAVDHPGSKVPPCVHRAPHESSGEKRLLMIC